MKDKKGMKNVLIIPRREDKIFQSFIIVWKLPTGMVLDNIKIKSHFNIHCILKWLLMNQCFTAGSFKIRISLPIKLTTCNWFK